MIHHTIDVHPEPKDIPARFINEPWLIDNTIPGLYTGERLDSLRQPEEEPDNIRIYVPIDLNKQAILRRLDFLIAHYGEASEYNEMDFSMHVGNLIHQIEIYDQIWYIRHIPEEGRHSREAIDLVKEFVENLESIPDACAECFPFDVIEELRTEYL